MLVRNHETLSIPSLPLREDGRKMNVPIVVIDDDYGYKHNNICVKVLTFVQSKKGLF